MANGTRCSATSNQFCKFTLPALKIYRIFSSVMFVHKCTLMYYSCKETNRHCSKFRSSCASGCMLILCAHQRFLLVRIIQGTVRPLRKAFNHTTWHSLRCRKSCVRDRQLSFVFHNNHEVAIRLRHSKQMVASQCSVCISFAVSCFGTVLYLCNPVNLK